MSKISRILSLAVTGILTAAIFVVILRRRRSSQDPAGSPQAVTGVTGEGFAARTPASDGPRLATPPPDAPGPSVTPPAGGGSDVERAEAVDAAASVSGGTGDALVAQQESAAAAEAAAIGGYVPSETGDPAMDPVYQAGGGEQDGWEQAEDELIENATHGEGHGDPLADAFAPELESDRSGAVYAETDALSSTELDEDPATRADGPGARR